MEQVYEKRKRLIAEQTDIIIDSWNTEQYSEFITKTGGDVCTFRVYGKGPFTITER